MTYPPNNTADTTRRAAIGLALGDSVLIIPVSPLTKKPLISNWTKRGSKDPTQINEWWKKWSDAMVGVLTGAGSGVWALDIDNRHNGSESLTCLQLFHGRLPATASHTTPGGRRLYFKYPKGVTLKSRSSDIAPGIDVRGGTACGLAKGQAIVPPSIRADGRRYEWEQGCAGLDLCVDAPLWLLFRAIFSKRDRARLAECGITGPEGFTDLPVEQWEAAKREMVRPARESSDLVHDLGAPQAAELTRYLEKAIQAECETIRGAADGVQDQTLNDAGLKIWSLLKGASDLGLDTADLEEMAEREYIAAAIEMVPSREPWEPEHAEAKWSRTEADAEPRDLTHVVQNARSPSDGFKGLTVGEPSRLIIERGAQEACIAWPDVDKNDKPKANSAANVRKLLETLAVEVRFNEFTGTIEVQWGSDFVELNDLLLSKLWSAAQDQRLACKIDSLQRLIAVVADRNRHHPVLAYLQNLEWDGTRRVDALLVTHFGAEDTQLNQAFGRSALLGAVRRIAGPGCKHDTMLVLEGPQGSEKSSAIAVLGGPFFSDGLRLGLGAKETIEQTSGVWLAEIAELGGMQAREIEAIKAQLSCQVDKARMAFDRLTRAVPRQWIMIGTTNSDKYLKDPTGNRRFCPVKVGKIRLSDLRRDRDQIWAEAFARVSAGESAGIPSDLWSAAANAQDARRMVHPIEDWARELFDAASGIIAKADIWRALGRPNAADRKQPEMNILNDAMRRMGWEAAKQRPRGDDPVPVFQKLVPGEPREWLTCQGGKLQLLREHGIEKTAISIWARNTEPDPEQKTH